ncbi:class I SAM-dependent methyltransferase [Pseudonocardia saturnea]
MTETATVNDRALALLDVAEGERVLEVGFGPGRAIGELAARDARVTGVDPSPVMLAAARRRNAAAVEAGQFHLHAGVVAALPLPGAAVDAVLAVHTLYFWPDLADGLKEIRRILAVGGRVVLAFRAAEHGLPRRFDPAVYRVPTTVQAQHALRGAGFDEINLELDPHGITHLTARTRASSDTTSVNRAARPGPSG